MPVATELLCMCQYIVRKLKVKDQGIKAVDGKAISCIMAGLEATKVAAL